MPTASETDDRVRRLLVAGGGITGLAAARAGLAAGLEVTLVEAGTGYGGKLALGEVAGCAVDLGAESILARRPEAVALAREVGLADEIVHPATSAARIWSRGALHPIPAGQLMGVPGDFKALAASGILDRAGIDRVMADERFMDYPVADDVAVGAYVGYRVGREVVDRLVEPLLGGVYAGRADRLSLHATIPQLAPLAAAGTSLTVGVRELLARGAAGASATGAAPRPMFAGIRGGIGRLPAAVAADVAEHGADLRTGTTLKALRRAPEGWRGVLSDGSVVEADLVVLAVPAYAAAALLTGPAPDAAAGLAEIEYASMAIATFAFRRSEIESTPSGSGFLVPPVDGRAIKASTFSSTKWPWLADRDADLFVLRASLGRHGEAEILERDDEEVAAAALGDLAAAVGLTAAPVDRHVQRWCDALPQYAVGHLDRVARIRAGLPPGIAVAGAAYDGVGVPACIASAKSAVGSLTAEH